MVMIVPRTPDAGESFVITGLTATLSVELWNPVAAAVTVALPPGRVKYVNLVNLQLPAPPAAMVAQINDYIKRSQLQPVPA